MKKIGAFLLLFIFCNACFSQDAFSEYNKLNHALRGLSSMKFPTSDSVEQSMILRLTVDKKSKAVCRVEYLGNVPISQRRGKCLCTAEEVKMLINEQKIPWKLFLANWSCDTAIVHLPIIFRNETVQTYMPKGFSLYRDCGTLLFEHAPVLGGCSVLLKPILVILEEVIEN
jgi:hypothetical protein